MWRVSQIMEKLPLRVWTHLRSSNQCRMSQIFFVLGKKQIKWSKCVCDFKTSILVDLIKASLNPSFHSTLLLGLVQSVTVTQLAVIQTRSKIMSQEQESLMIISTKRVKREGLPISTQSLHSHYSLLPSGHRFRSLLFRTKKAASSFLPTLIWLLNS